MYARTIVAIASDHNNIAVLAQLYWTRGISFNIIIIVPTHVIKELKGLSCMLIIPIPKVFLVTMETEAPALRLTLCDLVDFISKYAMFCRVH